MCMSKQVSAAALVLTASLSAWPLLSAAGDAVAKVAKPAGPSLVEPITGTKLSRVTLTQKAAERLDIKTVKITVDGSGMMSAPYAAVLYDVKGNAWVYTNPGRLAYVRHAIVVGSIKGEHALLKEGPPVGTEIVVVGASELYGAESGIGK